jgi:Putative Actinobacterial Holin-X, holin superfamily III
MTRVDNTRTIAVADRSSLVGLVQLASRLLPRQLNDELSLAAAELKGKGVKVGVAAGILAAALVLLIAMAISLLVAAILGLGEAIAPWLSALLFAAFFLVVGGILGLVGAMKIKKEMPLLPENAIRGIKHDIGVMKEGRSFDPATLDRKPEKKEEPKQDKAEQEHKEPAPSLEELRARAGERREHLARIRDGLGRKLDVKPQSERIKSDAASAASRARHAAEVRIAAVKRNASGRSDGSGYDLQERWKPLAALAASLTAFAVLLRRLLQK